MGGGMTVPTPAVGALSPACAPVADSGWTAGTPTLWIHSGATLPDHRR
jgi:hypothetical protein